MKADAACPKLCPLQSELSWAPGHIPATQSMCGKQQTVTFHVDDLKRSHVDKKVNDLFVKWLDAKHGDKKSLTPFVRTDLEDKTNISEADILDPSSLNCKAS